jgi:diketogulonate reductase-like aldo/keto reductase
MQEVTLNNGLKMPILGFGVYQIPDPAECERSVLEALKIGYRSIDTAAVYTNEAAVGTAIKNSEIPREDIFITTKLWIQDMGYGSAKKAVEKSLKKLKTDYIDLYLIHQPMGDVHGAWRAMEDMYKAGILKAIGVSNFQADRLMDLMVHNKIIPALNQVETHPFFQQIAPQEFMKEHNIQVESWAPFAQGKNDIFKNNILSPIAKKYDKTVAQVVLRWLIQRDIVVIPKSATKERIAENFDVFDFQLSDDEMNEIMKLDGKESLFFDNRDPLTVKTMGTYKIR